MYLQFFNFREAPFAIEPNPRFIILNEEHQEALATLVYAIEQREGWALLLGYPGVGKTTLIMALFREMGDSVVAGVITNPRLEPLDFFNMVALELGMEGPMASKGQFLVALRNLIGRYRQEGRAILLVVDEAHSLTLDLLEEIRLLGNLDDSSPRVLNIFLVGQPQVLRLLKQASDRGLLQRFRRYHILKPLDSSGTASYIRHRLKVAGGDPNIFNPAALNAIHELTDGNCRLINSLCDEALLLAFTREQRVVSQAIVHEAAEDNPALRLQKSQLSARPPAPKPAPEPAGPSSKDEALPAATAVRAPAAPKSGKPEPPPAAPPTPQPPRDSEAALGAIQAESLIPGLDPDMGHGFESPPEPKARAAKVKPEASTPAKKVRRPKKSPAQKGRAGRFAASLSREAPHGLLKRVVVLALVLGILVGGYQYLAGGGYGRLKMLFYRVTGLGGPELMVPERPALRPQTTKDPLAAGKKDWGPVAPAPPAGERQAPADKQGPPGSDQGG